MKISVIIPTYKRWSDLERLLKSLANQEIQPDEVITIIGPADTESVKIVTLYQKQFSALRIIMAEKESVVHALNAGLAAAVNDVICLLDDDVSVPADWSKRITSAFELNSKLGAYGGRDKLQFGNEAEHIHISNPPAAHTIGTFRWDGVLVGNHHCGALKSPCEVDVLKGANLSLRRQALHPLQIDPALEWKGAETCWESDICQRIQKMGFQVVYDNENYVFHYTGQRLAFDHRGDIFSPAWPKRIYNEGHITAKFRPPAEILIFTIRTFLVGSAAQPGFLRSIIFFPKYNWKTLIIPWRNTGFLIQGIFSGFRTRIRANR